MAVNRKRIIKRTVWRKTRRSPKARKPVMTDAARSYLNSRELGISLNQSSGAHPYNNFSNNSDTGQRRA